MRRTTLLAAIASLPALATSCGARSSLEVAAAASSGGGEETDRCAAVQIAEPVIVVPDAGDLRRPSLLVFTGAASGAAIVYSKQFEGSLPIGRVASFPAWGAWPPPTLEPLDMIDIVGEGVAGESLVAAPSAASPTAAAALFRTKDPLRSALVRGDAATGSFSENLFVTDGGEALSLVPDASRERHLGFIGRHDPGDDYALDVFLGGAGGVTAFHRIACTTTPSAADAVATPSGWIASTATHEDHSRWGPSLDMPCNAQFIKYGAATQMTYMEVDLEGKLPGDSYTSRPAHGVVSRLRLAPRGDGAFTVWSTADTAKLHAGVFGSDEGGDVLTLTSALGELVPDAFAVEGFGDDLILATAVALTNGVQVVEARRLSADADERWSAAIPTQGSLSGDGPITMAASPEGDAYLLAWTERSIDGAASQVRIARLDCIEGQGQGQGQGPKP